MLKSAFLFLQASAADVQWQAHLGSDCDGVDLAPQPTEGLPSLSECPNAIDGHCQGGHMSEECVAKLQAVCESTTGCAGFNTDRVFKTSACLNKIQALPSIESCVDLYLRGDAPAPPPPPGHIPVWPLPASMTSGSNRIFLPRDGSFQFRIGTGAGCEAGGSSPVLRKAVQRFSQIVQPTRDAKATGTIIPAVDVCVSSAVDRLGPTTNESYSLTVPDDGSPGTIVAATAYGAMYAMETFVQLISLRYTLQFGGQTPPPGIQSNISFDEGLIVVAPVTIKDAPRYSYRGLMIDTSRHFLPVAFLKRVIDGLAQSKLNVLHWHLIDTEAFPVGSDTFPELAAKGAWDGSAIYSPTDLREVVAYAADRGVRVMPEFDMPGHGAWGKSMPELMACPSCIEFDPTNDDLYPFLQKFLLEMTEIFPDAYLHLGGDEVSTRDWTLSSSIQAWLKQRNMTVTDLEPYFWQRMRSDVLPALNRTLSVWEGDGLHIDLATLPDGAVVNAYESLATAHKAVAAGVRTVVSISKSHWYLDHECPGQYNWNSWKCIYPVDPGTATSGLPAVTAELLLGGETAMWGEGINVDNFDAFVWHGAAAAAERLWSPLAQTDKVTDATTFRLAGHVCRMRRRGIGAGPVDRGYCPEDVTGLTREAIQAEEIARLRAELTRLVLV